MARSRRSPPLPHAGEVRARDCTERSTAKTAIVLCIDGDEYEARERFCRGIGGVKEWCEEGGITVDVSDIFGPGRKVVTTRAGGVLDVELKYKGRSLTFVIQGRNLYIRGWRARGKVFELNDENQKENFILDKNCIKLKTGLNYSDLISRGVGRVPTGLFHLRKAFDKLWRHAGGEDVDISEEVAIIAVHISEASRYPPILRFICKSFTDLGLSRLGKDPINCTYVTNYKRASGIVMQNVDRMKAGKEPLPIRINGLEHKTMDELASDVGILFRDGYNEERSNFEHEDSPRVPIFETTMNHIGPGVQRKRKCAQEDSQNKRQKGGSGAKRGPGSIGERKGLNGGSWMQGGQWLRRGRGPKGGGSGGFSASFHSAGGPKDRIGRSPASFHHTGGPKDRVGRHGVSFHPPGEGLKGLLDDDEHAVTSSIGMGAAVRLRTAGVHHFQRPFSSHKYISDEDQSMNILTHRKMWIFPNSPLPSRKTFPPLLSLLAPHSLLLRTAHEQERALPLLLDGTPLHRCRPSLNGILKTRYISRALRFIH